MGAKTDPATHKATEPQLSERRQRRSTCLADALRFQLDACREEEGLAAIVVSDELGFCVAHSGGDGAHDELAARLPMLVNPASPRSSGGDEPPLDSGQDGYDDGSDDALPVAGPLAVTTFPIAGAVLHACAVGAPPAADGRDVALARVASGFTRLLAE